MIDVATFEYLHTCIPYEGDDEGDDDDVEALQVELNRLGQEGWELVNMTPHWEWAYDSIEVTHMYSEPDVSSSEYVVEAPYSMPDYISGWYCTFKRPLG